MCGITGIISFDGQSVPEDVLLGMISQITYRGPDESGIYIGKGVGLGNVRLSIIDISNGKQPMSNADKTLWIVYNGEVYNYIELRKNLIKLGVKLNTNSDTEVVLKYYEKFGEKCLDYFNGQFAIAIWDTKNQELFLARDRVGIRPLYYYSKNGLFIFGSEIKSILVHPSVEAELDIDKLSEVFTFWTTITPNTCFKNIAEVSPGQYLKISKTKTIAKKYWELTFNSDYEFGKYEINTAAEELHKILMDAASIRLRADVPVAAYLSGGIDSTATTYLLKQVLDNRLQTFSIGFTEKEFDESEFQKEVSSFLETNHTSFICTNNEIGEYFKKVIWHTEMPLLRTSPVPMFLLSKHVKENNIKVVITGEGADEMLGGYNIFKEMQIKRFWANYPDSKIRPLLLKRLYPYISNLQKQDIRTLKFFFGYKLDQTNSPYYSHLLRWNNSSKIIGFLNHGYGENINSINLLSRLDSILPDNFESWDSLEKSQWLESTIFMSGYLLSSQGDRMAMANSVEGRYPFLDHHVIEFCSKLHPELKLHGLNEKYILKKAMNGKIPESVIRRTKQAYRAPIRNVFFNSITNSLIADYLCLDKINEYGIFDALRIQQLISRFSQNRTSELDDMALTAVISTQILMDLFIKNFQRAKSISNCKISYQE